MPSSPFPPRPVPPPRQDDPGGGRHHSRAPSNNPVRLYSPQNDPVRTPRSILRPAPPTPQHNPTTSTQISRPQLPITRSITPSPFHHHHTSSSPELRPRVDNSWTPRVRPYSQQPPLNLSQSADPSSPTNPSHIDLRSRTPQADATKRWSGLAARIPHLVPGIRGRSASDARIAHTPPPDLEPDRLARACGQVPTDPYLHDHRARLVPIDTALSRPRDQNAGRGLEPPVLHPSPPKISVSHMYRRLDALARRASGRAMDYVSFGDMAAMHKRDNHIREQLRRKRTERLLEKDPNFHAIGAPLEDIVLYASTSIIIGDYQHHLPVVVVACVEELTKTGIYQSGLFRALPSRDRHLQLIDLFDKSADFGAQFNMRGQAMPDICALLSTFISSLPNPLLDPQIYAALWHWAVKPSVKRQDARRDQQEEEEEERRSRGELPRPAAWMSHTDLYLDETDIELEADQLSTAQILLRFLPSANLSLLIYLCAFFTQLPLCPENGLQLEDVARIFGHRLLGGTVKVMSQRMMMWLLTRWHRISDTLFSETCGMTPPPSPSYPPHPDGSSAIVGEASELRIEKRKGRRQSTSDDALRQAPSSSSSYSSRSTESPEERAPSLEEGKMSEGSQRRKKRGLDTQETRTHVGHRSSTRKESRHGHGHGHARRGSGSRRHHHAHGSEQNSALMSPDPFAIAFANAQKDLADSPLLANPSNSAIPQDQGVDMIDDTREMRSSTSTSARHHPRRDTPARVAGFEPMPKNETDHDHVGSTGNTIQVDARVVDALLQEREASRALVERVEVLERALKVRDGETHAERVDVRPDVDVDVERMDQDAGGETRLDNDLNDRGVEDGLRLQLRLVEAERDRAQQMVRNMQAYLLDGGTLER